MSILSKIGINGDKQFIASIGSSAMVGKTTVMVVLATELVKEGKSVLFVSDDRSAHILRKASNFMDAKKTSKFVVIGNFSNRWYTLNSLVEGREFDYVFLDSFIFNDNDKFLETINFVKSQKFSTFVSVQLKRTIEPILNVQSMDSNVVSQKVDYMFVLTKKEMLNFFDKLKYWIRFAKVPNFNLNLIKARYGKSTKFDFHIDFTKLDKNR